jgi:hypothetical protein
LARTDRYDAALALLDSSINHVQGRDRLRVLRLTCTKAQIIAAMDQDRAYPLAKFVEREAQLLGAKNISRAATRVVSATRIQL